MHNVCTPTRLLHGLEKQLPSQIAEKLDFKYAESHITSCKIFSKYYKGHKQQTFKANLNPSSKVKLE